MKYTPTDVAGVTIVDIEPHRDDRGFFSQSFCADEFSKYGLLSNVAQMNICYNYARGTLRGLHRQVPPYAEAKLVRCTRGAIVDVAVDARPGSRTYRKHVMVQLSADNHRYRVPPPVTVIPEKAPAGRFWPHLRALHHEARSARPSDFRTVGAAPNGRLE